LKVLSFSYCFPNGAKPTWGVFVKQRLVALGRRAELQVVAPVPSFPLIRGFGRQGSERAEGAADGLTVHRPSFLCIPVVLKSLDGRLYGRGLRRWLAQLLEEWQPDLLDAHFVWPDGVGVSLLAREVHLPYAITLRGKIYPCLEARSQRRQCAAALQSASAVISVSAPMAAEARELGVRPDRLHVIPNGVDTEMFRPREKPAARKQLSLPESGRLLVTVAHLGARKGHYETIGALPRLPQDVRLVLVGGDRGTGRDERAILELTDRLGVTDRVILAGTQPYERIPLYFSAADASVLASYREGCPNVVLESLACGTPVVATGVGAVPELLSTPDNGRIVPPRDVDALAEAIQEVLDAKWSAESLARAPAVKAWDDVAEEVHGVFTRVVHGP